MFVYLEKGFLKRQLARENYANVHWGCQNRTAWEGRSAEEKTRLLGIAQNTQGDSELKKF